MDEERVTKRLTASEREALTRLSVACDIIDKTKAELDKRRKMIPYGSRDTEMVKKVLEKLLANYIKTIPIEQLPSYVNNMRMVSYVVGVKRPGVIGGRDEENFGMWLPYETLNILFDGCHDKCITCMEDTEGQKRCRLRKALDSIPNDVEDKGDGSCPYYSVI